MLFKIDLGREQKWKYHVGIGGFEGCPTGRSVENLLGRIRALHSDQPLLTVQLFDAERIVTHLHLLASAVYALQAFKTLSNVSKTIETENLLYASARRQIDDAIDRVGLKATSQNVGVAIIGSQSDTVAKSMEKVHQELGGQVNDGVLSVRDPRKAEVIVRTFEISDIEVEAAKSETLIGQTNTALVKRILSKISIMAISN